MSHEHDHCHDHQDSCCSHDHHQHSCCHEHHHEDFAHQLLQLADEAWMEVLKEKIKEEVRQHNGPHLDALAKLVAETNNNRWKNKLGIQNTVEDFKGRLGDLFKK